MTSSVIYYSTDARKNEMYLLNSTHLVDKYQQLGQIKSSVKSRIFGQFKTSLTSAALD